MKRFGDASPSIRSEASGAAQLSANLWGWRFSQRWFFSFLAEKSLVFGALGHRSVLCELLLGVISHFTVEQSSGCRTKKTCGAKTKRRRLFSLPRRMRGRGFLVSKLFWSWNCGKTVWSGSRRTWGTNKSWWIPWMGPASPCTQTAGIELVFLDTGASFQVVYVTNPNQTWEIIMYDWGFELRTVTSGRSQTDSCWVRTISAGACLLGAVKVWGGRRNCCKFSASKAENLLHQSEKSWL